METVQESKSFFDLPFQVRHRIYRHYVSVNGGYLYNADTNKLRTVDDEPIELSLAYTCRTVAFEMKSLPLETNTITFYPHYTKETLPFAYAQGIMLQRTHRLKCEMFQRAQRCFAEEVKTEFGKRYPQFMAIFDDFNSSLRLENVGHPPSEVYDAIDYALKLASSHPNFKDDVDDLKYEYVHVTKCGFSAAALAIGFLESITVRSLRAIRKIVLEENHPAVALSASHAKGLISFCRYNTDLRVERRVHLWHNIFLQGALPRNCLYTPICLIPRGPDALDAKLTEAMTRSVALWTVEALSLIPAGMPVKSFSLVFHGDIEPEKCSEVFQNVIMRDATWQAAMEKNVELGVLELLEFFHRPCSSFPFDTFAGFPQALEDIANKRNPIIRCDFDIGEYSASDAKDLADDRRKWTLDLWRLRWFDVGLVNWNDIPVLLRKIPLLRKLISRF
ncbi:hypothetical protein F4806DRAFT_508356 [Annulohypoxylon nitens]|nr:hypothetical protein F4806DRAFT_508356 [Annulohypoxylon nitens]